MSSWTKCVNTGLTLVLSKFSWGTGDGQYPGTNRWAWHTIIKREDETRMMRRRVILMRCYCRWLSRIPFLVNKTREKHSLTRECTWTQEEFIPKILWQETNERYDLKTTNKNIEDVSGQDFQDFHFDTFIQGIKEGSLVSWVQDWILCLIFILLFLFGSWEEPSYHLIPGIVWKTVRNQICLVFYDICKVNCDNRTSSWISILWGIRDSLLVFSVSLESLFSLSFSSKTESSRHKNITRTGSGMYSISLSMSSLYYPFAWFKIKMHLSPLFHSSFIPLLFLSSATDPSKSSLEKNEQTWLKNVVSQMREKHVGDFSRVTLLSLQQMDDDDDGGGRSKCGDQDKVTSK